MKFSNDVLRDAFGQFATGVCVVTAEPAGHEPLGITVNSFASVSLDPPLILWCLKKGTEFYHVFAAADYFVVNVLTDADQDRSSRYANKDSQKLESGTYYPGSTGSPILKNMLAVYECKKAGQLEGGDHIIILGEVIGLEKNSGTPLIYYNGRYRELENT